jgi:hypothetical protein
MLSRARLPSLRPVAGVGVARTARSSTADAISRPSRSRAQAGGHGGIHGCIRQVVGRVVSRYQHSGPRRCRRIGRVHSRGRVRPPPRNTYGGGRWWRQPLPAMGVGPSGARSEPKRTKYRDATRS